MCGIVGYIGDEDAVPKLLRCLGHLEYRGYDSAGIGILSSGNLEMRRSIGKNTALHKQIQKFPLNGNTGIAHTRWATHGIPSETNAHPHTDCGASLAVVHNGIIENYLELKKDLEKAGHIFCSETDSEVVAHLLEEGIKDGLEEAALDVIPKLKGAYAIAAISKLEPEKIVIACAGGPPLVIGYNSSGTFIASDTLAFANEVEDIQVLRDGEIAVIDRKNVRIRKFNGERVFKKKIKISWETESTQKGSYPHFMLKEIFEQPDAVFNTLDAQLDSATGKLSFPWAGIFLDPRKMQSVEYITIVACGTSWHAALVGKQLIEFMSRTRVNVEIASEYRYQPVVEGSGRTLVIGISQSGETADTIGALREASKRGCNTLSICNVSGSTMSRESDGVIYTHAGVEIGVAATKSFTCQLAVLYMFAVYFGTLKGLLSQQEADGLMSELKKIPRLITEILEKKAVLEDLSHSFDHCSSALFLGRGIYYPLAVEGALKLKEISYVHAEGYPAGELKHGAIALVNDQMPVLIIAPLGRLYGKVFSAIEEVKARGGHVIALASEDDNEIALRADQVFRIPKCTELLMPILVAIPMQLISYYTGIHLGCDVDKPRNLAKSVTVE